MKDELIFFTLHPFNDDVRDLLIIPLLPGDQLSMLQS
jgi:hypothetical protein